MAEIRLEQVSVKYGDHYAVRDVTFTVADKALYVLVGPSGSGKTTILRAIAGFLPLSHGSIRIGGRQVNQIHPRDRNIAMVYQTRALYPHMTVRENWRFPLEAIGQDEAEITQRVQQVAEMLEMTPFLDRYPAQLSGGQQQRVALGRALVRRPSLFLLDEPLGGLDAKLRVAARSNFKRIHADLEVTTLYVTHDQAEAQALGSRLIVLNEGQVQQVGTPDEIYDEPANRFVAGFIGTPPMNFIDCSLTSADQGLALVHGALQVPLPAPKAAAVEAKAPQRVVLGVRPEHIRLTPQPVAGSVPVEVFVTEPQGHEVIVDLRFNDNILKMRGSTDTDLPFQLNLGDTVYMSIDPDKTYVFDGTTGERLDRPINVRADTEANWRG